MLKTVRFFIGEKGLKMDLDLPPRHTESDVLTAIVGKVRVHDVSEPELFNDPASAFDFLGSNNPFRKRP